MIKEGTFFADKMDDKGKYLQVSQVLLSTFRYYKVP
jgi:hypothetical protein